MRPRTSTEHGQYGYAKRVKCRCDLCMTTVHRYDKKRRLNAHQGLTSRVDTTEVKAHLQRLVDAGLSLGQIARATGGVVTETQVRRLLHGHAGKPVTWAYRPSVEALLAVTYRTASAQQAITSSLGTQRRIEALKYMGYGTVDLARLLDVTDEAVHAYSRRKRILVSTARRVRELYDKYSLVPGPNEAARWKAYRAGAVSPMAWDDEDMDDPDAEPDRTAMTCLVGECRRTPERMNLCTWHLRLMKDRDALDEAEKFRWHVKALGRLRHKAGGDHMFAELADLKAMGMNVYEAASKSGYSLQYVEKHWGRVS